MSGIRAARSGDDGEDNKKAGGMNRPAFRIRPASRPTEHQIVAIQVASRPFWAVCTVNFTRC